MKNDNKTQIVILAAGKGTRMKSEEPKALATFKNKPFIKHILETIAELNQELKPIIVVGYKKEKVMETLGKSQIYAKQMKQLGTGHAVLSAREKALSNPHDTVLVISTDQPHISKETLFSIMQRHQEKKPSITLGTVAVPDFQGWRAEIYKTFGRIIREENGLVKKIVEFKDATKKEKKVRELNPALYAFEADWLWNNIEKLKNENAQSEYYLTDLVKIACDQNKKIEAVAISNIIEILQPNSKEELELLEKVAV